VRVPIKGKATEAGIFSASEVALLYRVFNLTRVSGENDEKRDERASRIIANYMAGVTDETELAAISKQALGR
jgi:hypothetical protein